MCTPNPQNGFYAEKDPRTLFSERFFRRGGVLRVKAYYVYAEPTKWLLCGKRSAENEKTPSKALQLRRRYFQRNQAILFR